MPLSEIIHSDGALIGLWEMNETEQELLALLKDATCYQSDLNQFVSQKRRIEFLTVRVMLEQLLNQDAIIGYYPSGKPYLKGSEFKISISHTNGYAAIMLHSHRTVAIDIEQRAPKVMRLQSKFMNEDEIIGTDISAPLDYALICWSAKETLFKMIDQEEIDFKKHLHLLQINTIKSEGSFTGIFEKNETRRIFELHYRSTHSYVLTWSTDLKELILYS
ncbi:MAG: siderophore biosynthesis protein [Bacteroidales bacterium]